MDPDEKFRSGRGPEGPDDLRSMLREWKVPGAPPAIEADLRQTFRRRRSGRRRTMTWLGIAAGLALVVLYQVRRPEPPRVADRPAIPPSPIGPAPTAAVAPNTTALPTAVATSAPVRRRASPAPSREPEIIVEPGQAELIARLVRGLNQTTWTPGRVTTNAPRVESAPVEVRAVEIADVALPAVRVGAVNVRSVEWPVNDVDLSVEKSSLNEPGGGV